MMPQPTPNPVWFKSSRSNNTGGNNCVEVAFLGDGNVGVRDSKNRDLPAHTYTPGEWDAFLAGAKDGEFDRP
jgi:hypothetical protein